MNNKLSIIIPCYNCSRTLEEAVVSIFDQSLKVPFEIIMVDDRSIDGTRDLMISLSKKHDEIKLIFHDRNRGGGATRNTGIKNSNGDYIFCLDGDNLFGPMALQKMIDYAEEKKCDGVVIEERRFFQDFDKNNIDSYFNKVIDRPISIVDLFDNGSVLLDNFLFTRESFLRTRGGYPEEHGFDTQCFEFRFLGAGNLVYVCPETIFMHRQDTGGGGYFQRVYEQGFFSINMYLIYEEIIHLFSKELCEEIIDYDIFENNKLGNKNIKSFLEKKFKNMGSSILRNDFEKYLIVDGLDLAASEEVLPGDIAGNFVRGVSLYKKQEFKEALCVFENLLSKRKKSKILKYNIIRSKLSLTSEVSAISIEIESLKTGGFMPKRRQIVWKIGKFKKMLINIKKTIGL